MSKTISVTAAAFAVARQAGLVSKPGAHNMEMTRLINETLDRLESDPAALESFLARIPTRLVPVNANVATRAARTKALLRGRKLVRGVGGSLSYVDDAINRALDREESRAAVRRALEGKR